MNHYLTSFIAMTVGVWALFHGMIWQGGACLIAAGFLIFRIAMLDPSLREIPSMSVPVNDEDVNVIDLTKRIAAERQ